MPDQFIEQSAIMFAFVRMRLALVIAALAVGTSCAAPRSFRARGDDPIPADRPTAEVIEGWVAEVVELHNAERAAAKLPKLEVSAMLRKAAVRQADDMASTGKMSHKGSDGSTSAERIRQAGYHYRRAGENVAYGKLTPTRLMRGWMESPPHRRNILGGYSQVGVACTVAEDGTTYWAVTFGLPASR